MIILVDAMGGDNAPDEIVKGALDASNRLGIEIKLVGRGEDILRSLERMGKSGLPEKVKIVNATEVIEFDEDPTTAIRTKKDSSLSVGLTMLRDGQGDAFVSAGSTGALLTGATLIVKRIRGLRRAAMAPVIPNAKKGFILIDCGANADCTPEYLLQFAYMGSFYAENVLEVKSPRVGLLSNGSEETKGAALQFETFGLLKKSDLNFIGNIEASAAIKGQCDVLVCDGFTGNIMLKTIEGTAKFIMSEIKSALMSGTVSKIGALLIKKRMGVLKEKLDPGAIGGTALLGISKPVLKAHGSSDANAIYNAINRAVKDVELDIASRIRDNISKITIDISADKS